MTNITNEVLARLQNGEDAQAIANELADMLNAALDAHEEEQRKVAELEAKRQAEAEEALKRAKLDEIAEEFLGLLDEYLNLLCPDLLAELGCSVAEDLDVEDVHEAFEQVVGMLNFAKTLHALVPKSEPKVEVKPAVHEMTMTNPVKDVAIDPLMDFLRKNGLLK